MGMQVLDFSKANCKNCYRCIRTCKIKAIKVKNHQAKIEKDLCIACGECFLVCSQNARKIHSDLHKVKDFIKNKKTVIATLAPSYRGYFEDYKKFIGLLKNIGINRIEETGIAAAHVSKAYKNIVEKCEKNIYLTSSCASINSLIEKHYPQYIDYLLPVTTPLLLHGNILKNEYKDAKVVFIGPCLSKKTEILSQGNEGIIDAVLTFDELIEEYGDITNMNSENVDKEASIMGQIYPKSGGIGDYLEINGYKKISIQGIEDSIGFLQSIENLKENKLFVEINACKGGCLGGPAGEKCNTNYYERLINLEKNLGNIHVVEGSYKTDRKFYDKSIYKKDATENEIEKILYSMEKYTKDDELNCAACGYNSCREKAIAVIQGMSTIDMCIPFMRTKAERISNELFDNSPNGVIILDRNLEIKEINGAAKEKFYLDNNAIGNKITKYLDDSDFQRVLDTKESIIKKREQYAAYNLIALKNIIYLEDQKALLVIITNITKEEKQREELFTMKKNTLELTQEVINKQMRVAQEIASLLGETTAETKVALTKLKHIVEGEF